MPVVEEVSGRREVSFAGAAAKDVMFSCGGETVR